MAPRGPVGVSMDPVLESLIPLAGLDERVRALREQERSSERKLAAGAEKRDKAVAAQAALEATMQERRAATAAMEKELRRFEQQRDRATRALETGMGNAEAAQRQVDTCTERIDHFETEILEAMDVREADEAGLEAAIAAVAAARESLENLQTTHNPALETIRAELKVVDGERRPHIDALPTYEQRVYNELMSRKGYAIAALVDRTCTACQNTIPYMLHNDLKQGRPITCEKCHRWLFIRPSEAAEE